MIGKSILLKSFIISTLAFLISYGIFWILGSSLSYVGIDSSNLSYLQEYYKNRNMKDSTYHEANNIQFLCIDDTTNRENLAIALDTIFHYGPKVVGIDIFFKPDSNSNDSGTVKLKEIIRQHSDSIVLAQVYDDTGHIKKSVFDKDTLLCFGLIHSYNGDVFPYKDTLNETEYYNFAYQISRKYNPNLEDSLDLDYFVVNYSNLQFAPHYPLQYFANASKEEKEYINIKNKIVLIGVYDDPFDIHPTQFLIENKKMLSGIKMHAYAINSLINPNYALKHMPMKSLINIFLFWLLGFIYSLFYVLLTDKKCDCVTNHESVFNIIRPLVLIIIVPILLLGCYYYTNIHNIVPNVVPFLISVFIINTFNDFLSQNINSNKYE